VNSKINLKVNLGYSAEKETFDSTSKFTSFWIVNWFFGQSVVVRKWVLTDLSCGTLKEFIQFFTPPFYSWMLVIGANGFALAS
jgi:hypothetical protein